MPSLNAVADHRRIPALTRATAWTLAVVLVAAVGGLATDTSSAWYRGLDLPSFQPPGPVFGIVWGALYVAIAISAIIATRDERTDVVAAFAINLVLNVAWTWIFFQAHAPTAAGIEVLVLLVSTLDLIRRTRHEARVAAVLLAPYAAWVAFASALTWTIAATN